METISDAGGELKSAWTTKAIGPLCLRAFTNMPMGTRKSKQPKATIVAKFKRRKAGAMVIFDVKNNRLARLPHPSYAVAMKTLTIRLPDVLARQIERESAARRVSKSDIVRERLDQPALAPLQDGSLRDILEEGWEAKVPARPRQFRSLQKQKLAELIRAKKLHR
jgi:hypothetical protein